MDLIFLINEVVIVPQKLMITGLYWLVHVMALGFLVQAQSSTILQPKLLQMDQIWFTVDVTLAVPSLEAQNMVEDQFWLLLLQENLPRYGTLTILTPGKQVHTYSWICSVDRYNLDTMNSCMFCSENICSTVQAFLDFRNFWLTAVYNSIQFSSPLVLLSNLDLRGFCYP